MRARASWSTSAARPRWSRTGRTARPRNCSGATSCSMSPRNRRRAIDAIRRRTALQERYVLLAADPGVDEDVDPDRIDDDVLALMFISCHPVLSPEARVALTLRVVGGLSSEEIARAFLVSVPTVQARITRGKKTIAAAGVPFELPPPGERRERLGGVLSVLYVIFTEGSTATSGDRLVRPDVAYEAIRLV